MQGGAIQLEHQRLVVGIGDQYPGNAADGEAFEERGHMGMDGDEVVHLCLEHGDVQAQLRRPVVHAVPVDGSLGTAKAGKQVCPGRL